MTGRSRPVLSKTVGERQLLIFLPEMGNEIEITLAVILGSGPHRGPDRLRSFRGLI